jgi:hypothetical protein
VSGERNARLVEAIARVCHTVNMEYCRAFGDYSQPTWENAPEWQKQSARTGVQLHLNNPEASPASSHESWMDEKLRDGWKYGETKDPVNKTHPCIVPFEDLPPEQRAKDFIFRGIVHAIVTEQMS